MLTLPLAIHRWCCCTKALMILNGKWYDSLAWLVTDPIFIDLQESSRVSEVVPRIIQLKEVSHVSKVRSIPLIKAQRLSRW